VGASRQPEHSLVVMVLQTAQGPWGTLEVIVDRWYKSNQSPKCGGKKLRETKKREEVLLYSGPNTVIREKEERGLSIRNN
jgi:hypothetical protein